MDNRKLLFSDVGLFTIGPLAVNEVWLADIDVLKVIGNFDERLSELTRGMLMPRSTMTDWIVSS